jgi:anti-sigma B factor antagonist
MNRDQRDTIGFPATPEIFSLQTTPRADSVIVTVEGEIDMATSGRLRRELHRAVADAGANPVVVDMTGVSFLGSHGLAVLLEAREATRCENATLLLLRIVVDDTRPVIRPMEVSGVAEMLTLFRSVDDALAGSPELANPA